MTRRRTPRRAFLLMELVALLVLLAVFLLIVSELFLFSHRSQQQALRRTDLTGRVDSALAALRRDLWGASAATVAPDGTLTLTLRDLPVQYRTVPLPDPTLAGQEFRIERTADRETFAWNGTPAAAFSLDGPILTVTLGAGDRAERLTLTGPRLLASGDPR
jgi:hypothetical protein